MSSRGDLLGGRLFSSLDSARAHTTGLGYTQTAYRGVLTLFGTGAQGKKYKLKVGGEVSTGSSVRRVYFTCRRAHGKAINNNRGDEDRGSVMAAEGDSVSIILAAASHVTTIARDRDKVPDSRMRLGCGHENGESANKYALLIQARPDADVRQVTGFIAGDTVGMTKCDIQSIDNDAAWVDLEDEVSAVYERSLRQPTAQSAEPIHSHTAMPMVMSVAAPKASARSPVMSKRKHVQHSKNERVAKKGKRTLVVAADGHLVEEKQTNTQMVDAVQPTQPAERVVMRSTSPFQNPILPSGYFDDFRTDSPDFTTAFTAYAHHRGDIPTDDSLVDPDMIACPPAYNSDARDVLLQHTAEYAMESAATADRFW